MSLKVHRLGVLARAEYNSLVHCVCVAVLPIHELSKWVSSCS